MRIALFFACWWLAFTDGTVSPPQHKLAEADWPQWRGPTRNGSWVDIQLPDKLPAKASGVRWRRPIGGGYGGIAVVGQSVFVMDRQTKPREVERVLCLDVATGKERWVHSYPVTYGAMKYGNGPRSTPTVHAGKVYTFGARGHLHCLDANSGKVLWSQDTVKQWKGRIPRWGHACSPLIEGKRLFVQTGGQPNASLVALHKDTGKVLWRSLSDPPGYSSPVMMSTRKGRQLIYFSPRRVVGLDPTTGKVRWSVPFPGITYDVAISDPIVINRMILASNYWSGSKAILLDADGTHPRVIWEGKKLSLVMSTPLVRGQHVYALDRFQGMKCIELRTGKIKWEDLDVTPRGRNPQASLVWVGDRALILNARGELVLAELTPTKGKVVSKMPIIGRTWAHPAFAHGCVFARNDREILCVPIPKKQEKSPRE